LAKTWVLDTQTKGTGATMVPLERILRKPGSDAVPDFALPELRPPAPEQQEPHNPHSFKVIDVVSRAVLGEGIDARTAVQVLEGVRSIVDVTVYVWEDSTERWRMLTFGETKALWEHRGQLAPEPEHQRELAPEPASAERS
jgi:hypothetical protein